MSVALYRNIVQHLTQEKLEELKHQQNSLFQHFLPILQLAQDFSKSKTPIQVLDSLFTGLSTCPIKNIFTNDLLESVGHLLQNAQDDPALSSSLILDWVALVTTEIRQALRKCEYSFIFATVLNEWLEDEERQQQEDEQTSSQVSTTPQNDSKVEAIEKIKKIMLSKPPDHFDTAAFSLFLSENFVKREKADEEAILKGIIQTTKSFFTDDRDVVSRLDVINCVNGLRALKSLPPNKLGVLNDLKANHVAQQEIADLLTNRLTNIESWTWPKNVSIQVMDFRRGHTGEYKPFLNEDIITGLFLQYIGYKWSSHFNSQLEHIFYSKIWKRNSNASFTSVENIREGFYKNVFLMALSTSMSFHSGDGNSNINVNEDYVKIETTAPIGEDRGSVAVAHPTMTSLFGSVSNPVAPTQSSFSFSATTAPTSNTQAPTFGSFGSSQTSGFSFGASCGPNPNSTSAAFGQTTPRSAFGAEAKNFATFRPAPCFSQPKNLFSNWNPSTTSTPFHPQMSNVDKKQSFLHMLNVEMKLSQVISPPDSPLIIVQAEIEDFEFSVLHDSVLAVLQSFGVPSKWIKFFTKFMKLEVSFPGKESQPDKILRGLPTAHTLSIVFGELLLFILEFLINQHCDGLRVFRFQTEVWFWSNDTDQMKKGWEILNGFGKMIGLKIRDTRSGSISILSEEKIFRNYPNNRNNLIIYGPGPLPQAEIHWGYLTLQSKGIFQIDQNSIIKFVDEMKVLLEKSKTVLQWINIFNKYMAFFVKNFGKTANVSGKQHLDQIVAAVKLIYSKLFANVGGSPIDAMRQRFEILRENPVIDAAIYWPLKLGGLGLINPLIPVLSLKSSLQEAEDENPFKNSLTEDKRLWEDKKKIYDKQCAELAKAKGKINADTSSSAATTINIGFSPVIQVVIKPPSQSTFPTPELETFEQFVSKRVTQFPHWYSTYLKMLEIPTAKKFRLSPRLMELQRSFTFQGFKSFDDTYLAGLGNFYEAQLVKHFGTLNFVNEKLLPLSMIEKILDTDVKFD